MPQWREILYSELYKRIEPACCYITVFLGEEKVSEGTGFSYTPNGEVLTAAHVVTGRWPIRHEDYKDPSQKIFCKFPDLPLLEYGVFFCCIDVDVPAFVGRVQLDLALLLPKEQLPDLFPHVSAKIHPPRLGEEVFMAGYSEEVELPFRVDKLLAEKAPGAQAFRDAIHKGYMADMTGPLFKRGVVGNIRRIVAENSAAGERLECDVMYIDNAMNPGASGGPLFNRNGEAVGVISQRAVTAVDGGKETMLKVPSGCTVAISLAPLLHIARRTGGAAT